MRQRVNDISVYTSSLSFGNLNLKTTFANTLSPHSRVKGAARSIVTGIVQVVAVEAVISQLTESAEKVSSSDCLKDTLYPVTGDPPLSGSTQVTMT